MGFFQDQEQESKLGAAHPVPQSRIGSEVQEGPACPQQCGAVGTAVNGQTGDSGPCPGLTCFLTLSGESPINLPRPQSHSLRNELMGLNYLQGHCHHTLRFMSASAQCQQQLALTGTSQACSRGLVAPGEVGDIPGLEWDLRQLTDSCPLGLRNLPYKWL